MANFNAATQTVSDALTSGQIGTPVALRIVAHGTADHGHVERTAAEGLAAASRWFSQDPELLSVTGSAAAGQITTLSKSAGGQSALVSAGTTGIGRAVLAIEVWGNRGMLSWVDETFSGAPAADAALSTQAQRLLRKLQQWPRSDLAAHRTSVETTRASRSHRPLRPPYGVLLISGDSTHQPAYAAALAADPRCRLVGLTDEPHVNNRRQTLNAQLAARLGVPVLPDLDAALARDDVALVSLCAEPERRARIAVLAARAGKHLYLDKPLAASRADAHIIADAAGQAGICAHMFSMVHGHASQRARALIESRELGDLAAVHLDLTFAKGQAGTASLDSPRKEAADPDQVELPDSKREMTNVGVYAIVQLLTLFDQRVRRVTATTGSYFFRENQQNDMEDFGQMLLEFDGGLIATISTGRTGWHSHPAGGLNRAVLVGTRGCALIDAQQPRVEVWSDAPPWAPPDRNPEDPMGMWAAPPGSPFAIAPRRSWLAPAADVTAADVAHFLDCLEQGRPSAVTAELAAAATDILQAAYHSAASGQGERVNDEC